MGMIILFLFLLLILLSSLLDVLRRSFPAYFSFVILNIRRAIFTLDRRGR
jgi:hypothetical protein